MHTPHIILSLAGIGGCIALMISAFASKTYVFQSWAKIVSVLISVCWLIFWEGKAILNHWVLSRSTSIVIEDATRFCGGIGVGLLIAFIIARPYKRISDEKTPAASYEGSSGKS